MIHRKNYLLVRDYVKHRKEVDGVRENSISVIENRLKYLLIWANDTQFNSAPNKRPTYPDHVHSFKIGLSSRQRIVHEARRFFNWVHIHRPGYRNTITKSFVESLVPRRETSPPKEYEYVPFEFMLDMVAISAETIREKRTQAAAAFLYMSGARIDAFCTLPIMAIDIVKGTVLQFPTLGVRTKYRKHAITYLLDISELMPVVTGWDKWVRANLPKTAMWFASISQTGELIEREYIGRHRATQFRKDLRNFCTAHGLRYFSPHKYRHGHANYAMQRANTIREYKAVSQNLMHSDLSTTDRIYSILSEDDVGTIVRGLKESSQKDMEQLVEMLLKKLDEKQ